MEPFVADSALRCGWIHGMLSHPRHSLTLIAKGTYRLRAEAAAEPDPEPLDLAGDVHHDDDPEASLRYESDFAYWKPRADVSLVGRCHAPGGSPVARCRASVEVGGVGHEIEVVGDRRWWLPFGPFSGRTAPRPFTSMDLRYENAFGGRGSKRNPVGKGRRRVRDAEGRPLRALPNLVAPGARLLQPFSRPRPVGFGPVHRSWKPRTKGLGTYRRKWRRQRWPWFPENFDWGHFNAAPAPLQVPGYLRGDESYRLVNLHPERPLYTGRLPGVRARGFVLARLPDGGEDFREVPMVLDTVWIDAEAERLVLVWRGATEVESPEFEELERALFFSETTDAPSRDAAAARRLLDETAAAEAGAGEAELAASAPPAERPDPELAFQADFAQAREQLRAAGLDPVLADPEASDQQLLDAAWARIAAHMESLGTPPDEIAARKPKLMSPEELAAFYEQEGIEVPEARAELTRDEVERRHAAGETLAGLDLSGLDLSGLALREADLGGATLVETELSGADLTGASLAGAQAGRASLREAVLKGADLAGADLRGASLAGADLEGARCAELFAEGADLSGLRAAGADLTRAGLVAADLRDADLERAVLVEADLGEARLDRARFVEADLTAATLEDAEGEAVDFRGADLTGLRAGGGTRLPGARCEGVRGAGSVWDGAALAGARFDGAELSRALFGGADLAGASLVDANLPEARLDRAKLRDASLERANLFQGTLERADLRGADLGGASCYEVEFLDAELSGARLRRANLRSTKLA